ncbi:MAG: M18 family aminopeptidase [Myxococcota bacterium]
MKSPHPTSQDLLRYIDAGPTPRHCVAETARRLEAEGFSEVDEADRWSLEPGDGRYLVRGGTILAFRVGTEPPGDAGFRLLGAHTDSPNLRVKPVPDVRASGWDQLGVEAYGGLLEYTWLDRDLGLAGEVVLARDDAGGATGVEPRLVRVDRPVLRIPSLAIHLNREIREEGLKLNRQQHLPPILAPAPEGDEGDGTGTLRRMLSHELDVEPDRILSWDLSLMDVVPATFGGLHGELILAPRMDNQAMCHASLSALLRAEAAAATQVICLYDHEEIGSGSAAGAAGNLVREVLRRLAEAEAPGAAAGELTRAVARSLQISADMAHAVHPNYADRHDPQHMPRVNGGPVIKINAQQRYATDAETEARFEALCRDEGVPCQKFVNRTDLACGSTIGPISAARLGVRTVDVGNPMLAMHSIREVGGAEDPEHMTAVMARFLAA